MVKNQLRRWVQAGVGAAAAVTVSAVAVVVPAYAAPSATCPLLHIVSDQGTTESSTNASPTTDSGMLSSVVLPVLGALNKNAALVDRTYVPYPASFGGKPGDRDNETYQQSVDMGIANTKKVISGIHAQCPTTQIALMGYSQGAHVAHNVLTDIGNGTGPIPADLVALGALFSDPVRQKDAGPFPGAPDSQTTPSAPPGTSGQAVSQVQLDQQAPAQGGGIAPAQPGDNGTGFGSLSGRVYSACQTGDLACSADDAPVVKLATNIGGQLHLEQQDPQQTLIDVAVALGNTSIKAAANVVNDDVQTTDGTTRGLQYNPQQTLLSRVADGSDPQANADVLGAVVKVGLIAFNTGVTIAQKVLTPSNIAQLATVGLANPQAGLALFGEKLGAAALEMLPPIGVSDVQNAVFNEIQADVQQNGPALVSMATDVRYWDTVRLHGSYGSTPVTATGKAPTQFVSSWIISAISDLSRARFGGSGSAVSTPSIPTSMQTDLPSFAVTVPSYGSAPSVSVSTPDYGTDIPTPSGSETTSTSSAPSSAGAGSSATNPLIVPTTTTPAR